jgi:hypothetical protein
MYTLLSSFEKMLNLYPISYLNVGFTKYFWQKYDLFSEEQFSCHKQKYFSQCSCSRIKGYFFTHRVIFKFGNSEYMINRVFTPNNRLKPRFLLTHVTQYYF